jgi:hypothetical protein
LTQVFISYRHVQPDEGLAEALCTYLEERGLGVFLDKRIRVGLDWAEIDRQLRASSSFSSWRSRSAATWCARRWYRMSLCLRRIPAAQLVAAPDANPNPAGS